MGPTQPDRSCRHGPQAPSTCRPLCGLGAAGGPARCPQGAVSTFSGAGAQRARPSVVRVRFAHATGAICPVRARCTSATAFPRLAHWAARLTLFILPITVAFAHWMISDGPRIIRSAPFYFRGGLFICQGDQAWPLVLPECSSVASGSCSKPNGESMPATTSMPTRWRNPVHFNYPDHRREWGGVRKFAFTCGPNAFLEKAVMPGTRERSRQRLMYEAGRVRICDTSLANSRN